MDPTVVAWALAPPNRSRTAVLAAAFSGGTMGANGRPARDVLLDLMKTCRKLGVSFYRSSATACASPARRLSRRCRISSVKQPQRSDRTPLPRILPWLLSHRVLAERETAAGDEGGEQVGRRRKVLLSMPRKPG